MIARIWFAAAAAVLVAEAALAQGDTGFLRGAGKLDLSLSYSLDTYDEFWVGDDRTSGPFGRIDRHGINVYGAYGLTDGIDLVGNVSWVQAEADAIFDDENDLQDLSFGAKLRAWSGEVGPGKLSVLAFPGVKTPLTSYEDDAVNAIGDGQVDLKLRGVLQYLFSNGIFVALESGYDFRFDDPPDEVPIHLTVGGPIGPVTLSGFYSHIESLSGYDIGQGPFPGVEEEYDRLGAHVYWRIHDRFGLTASGWTTVDGKNTGDVDGFSLGGVLRF